MIAAPLRQDCIAFGVRFELVADSGDLLARMMRCAPHSTEACAGNADDVRQFALLANGSGTGYRLLTADEIAAEGAELQPVLDRFARDLMVHVADHAPDRVFVHAGVVGWQGQALVLPGTSYAGKTTLVSELVRAGATYYSDEYAVLDEEGRVHPYPRELQMRQPGGTEQSPVPVEHLSGTAGTVPLHVSHVVFSQYVEGGVWNPVPVSPGMAALEMLRHAIPVRRTPARVMATLAALMETAVALHSERGEAAETASALLIAMADGRPGA